VAKLLIDGSKVIRAYGTFPHPNIFGGFLLISLLISYFYRNMFHVEHYDIQDRNSSQKSHVLENTKFLVLFISIQFLALLLTFSKSAILGLLITTGYIVYFTNVPRGTLSLSQLKKMLHVEHLTRKLILIGGIIIALGLIIQPNTNSLLFKSLNERLFYLNVSRGTIAANPVIGIGDGQFVSDLGKYVPRGTIIQDWQYQPVHNIFLLIWSELGIIGLGMFVWLLWKMFHVEQSITKPSIKCSTWNNHACEVYEPLPNKNVPRGTFLAHQQTLIFLKGLLLGILFIGLFDHYLWDIQQGEILVWLIFGMAAGFGRLFD
jgi:O-antigen ligase